jgi:hypothetical protein
LALALFSRLALKASPMSMALSRSANKERGGYVAQPVFFASGCAGLENFDRLRGWSEVSPWHDLGKDCGRQGRDRGAALRSRSIHADQALSGAQVQAVAPVPSHRVQQGEGLQGLVPHRRLIARYRTARAEGDQLAASAQPGQNDRGGGGPPFARISAPYSGRPGGTRNLENSGPIAGAALARLSRGWKKSRNRGCGPIGSGEALCARKDVLSLTEQGLSHEKSRILLVCCGVRGFGLRHSPVDQGKGCRLGSGRG